MRLNLVALRQLAARLPPLVPVPDYRARCIAEENEN